MAKLDSETKSKERRLFEVNAIPLLKSGKYRLIGKETMREGEVLTSM